METLLVWPVTVMIAAVILGTVFLLVFRGSISTLILRTRRAGKDGVDFDHQQATPPTQTTPTLTYEGLMSQPVSATVLGQEAALAADLEEFKIKDDKKRVAMLQRCLAISLTNAEFYRIHSLIYGAQLDLLLSMLGSNAALPIGDVKSRFDQRKATLPEFYKNVEFKEWLDFLLNCRLIEATNEKVDLTQRGKDYLKFLVDTRGATQRPG